MIIAKIVGLMGAILPADAMMGEVHQAQNQTFCTEAEYRQLDFWVGEWNASWDAGNGTKGSGTNVITKDEYGSCVIYERFSAAGFDGMSVSTWHKPVSKWRQTWVDNQGGYFALVGGPVEGEEHTFELVNTRLSDSAPHLRMIWQDVTPDSFTWRWQNKQNAEDEWQDAWVINYTRVKK